MTEQGDRGEYTHKKWMTEQGDDDRAGGNVRAGGQ